MSLIGARGQWVFPANTAVVASWPLSGPLSYQD
jgi:hypothetical protein